MRKEFDISQFDKYREDNRREVKKSEWWTASFIMGYIFLFCQLLWWCHYLRDKRGKRWRLENNRTTK